MADGVRRGIATGWHILPQRQIVLGGMQAGRGLTRVLRLLGTDPGDHDAQQALDRLAVVAKHRGISIDGILHDVTTATGIGWDDGPGDLWWAALEAVAHESQQMLTVVEDIAGPTSRLIAGGGWMKRPAYAMAKRKALGRMLVPAVGEPGARGAALVAGVAHGVFGFDQLPPLDYKEIP